MGKELRKAPTTRAAIGTGGALVAANTAVAAVGAVGIATAGIGAAIAVGTVGAIYAGKKIKARKNKNSKGRLSPPNRKGLSKGNKGNGTFGSRKTSRSSSGRNANPRRASAVGGKKGNGLASLTGRKSLGNPFKTSSGRKGSSRIGSAKTRAAVGTGSGKKSLFSSISKPVASRYKRARSFFKKVAKVTKKGWNNKFCKWARKKAKNATRLWTAPKKRAPKPRKQHVTVEPLTIYETSDDAFSIRPLDALDPTPPQMAIPATAQTLTVGEQTMSMHPFIGTEESVLDEAARYEISSAHDVTSLIEGIAALNGALASAIREISGKLEEDFSMDHPGAKEMIEGFASVYDNLVDSSHEALEAFRADHEERFAHLENPDTNADKWDRSANLH